MAKFPKKALVAGAFGPGGVKKDPTRIVSNPGRDFENTNESEVKTLPLFPYVLLFPYEFNMG